MFIVNVCLFACLFGLVVIACFYLLWVWGFTDLWVFDFLLFDCFVCFKILLLLVWILLVALCCVLCLYFSLFCFVCFAGCVLVLIFDLFCCVVYLIMVYNA